MPTFLTAEIDQKLRLRIERQLAAEDAEATANRRANHHRDAGLQAGERTKQPPSLVSRPQRNRTRKEGSGKRYRVEFTIHSCQPLDWDNASSAIKECQDQLVRQGWLPDGDGWRELEGAAKSVKCDHKSEQRTVAIITRIA